MANGDLSQKSIIRSGVPQGTVLGPLCFLIMINSIEDDRISAFIFSFADDTKLNIGIRTINDANKLQESLDILYKWQDDSNMAFNATKFQVIQFGKCSFKTEYNYFTPDWNSPIIPSENVRDLGVQID